MLTNLDRAALAAYCGAYAFCAAATENVQKFGTNVAIVNRQAEIMMRIASEFGFTPASRIRISVSEPPLQDLFNWEVAENAGD